MSDEERLSDLELRIIRQDDLLDTLNFQVYQQAKKIAELEATCQALAGRLRETMNKQTSVVMDERPPHY